MGHKPYGLIMHCLFRKLSVTNRVNDNCVFATAQEETQPFGANVVALQAPRPRMWGERPTSAAPEPVPAPSARLLYIFI